MSFSLLSSSHPRKRILVPFIEEETEIQGPTNMLRTCGQLVGRQGQIQGLTQFWGVNKISPTPETFISTEQDKTTLGSAVLICGTI